jgi:hypothetical protein
LIIGYSFNDQHINELLLEGVQQYGLKIFILTTTSPSDFKSRLEHGHFYALPILKSVAGYFPYTLRDVFPMSQEETTHFKSIRSALLRP